jgi:plasmid stabilization system protein ParE
VSRSVFLEHLAEQDLDDHVDYIAADNPSAAARFIESVENAFARLAETPLIGVVGNSEIQDSREFVLGRSQVLKSTSSFIV